MTKFFSKSGQGFFDEDIHGFRQVFATNPAGGAHPTPVLVDNADCGIPVDAVEITSQAHAALLAGQAAGKMIVADAAGAPTLQDRPAPPFAQAKLAEFTTFRADRGKMLDCLSGMAGRFARAGDPASALACDVLAQGLLDLPAHPTVAAAQDVATLRAAMKSRYNTLLAAVPAPVMAAYKGVLA